MGIKKPNSVSECLLWHLRLRYFVEFRVGKLLLCKGPF